MVLELVGVPNLADDVRSLATGGRIIVDRRAARGAKAELNLLDLMGKRARSTGSTLRARSLEEKAAVARAVERHVLPLLASGARSGSRCEDAVPDVRGRRRLRAVRGGGKLGKLVLGQSQGSNGGYSSVSRYMYAMRRTFQPSTLTMNSRSPSGQEPVNSTAKNPMNRHTATPMNRRATAMRCGMTSRNRKKVVTRLRSASARVVDPQARQIARVGRRRGERERRVRVVQEHRVGLGPHLVAQAHALQAPRGPAGPCP